jgi:hypothetical protein
MRRITLLLLALVLVGCAKSEPPAEPAATSETPAGISLADVAGTWNGTITRMGSDTVLVNMELTATADTSGWAIRIANAKTPTAMTMVPLTVTEVAGDSITTDAGPFPSVLRAGQQVTTHSVFRLQNGQMVGSMVATYPASGESVPLYATMSRAAQ